MSRYVISVIFALICFTACQKQNTKAVNQEELYDMEAVIEEEIVYLLKNQKSLTKTLLTGDEEEKIEVTPADTAAWRQQFSSLIEANINKVAYLNAFEKTEKSKGTELQVIFTAIADETPVQRFAMKYQNDLLYAIDIVFMERNLVYSHIKEMSLYFDASGKHISSFTISGKEKMILKSGFDYEVLADIG